MVEVAEDCDTRIKKMGTIMRNTEIELKIMVTITKIDQWVNIVT